jgi:DNA-binding CsgD family transcriptional regulator
MGGLDDSNLLLSVMQALPLGAAIVDEDGAVVAMNGRFQRQRANWRTEPDGFVTVQLGSTGHRLVLERESAARKLAFEAFVARYALTRREAEVLTLLMEGLASRTIAARLELGVRTVETHVARLLQKSETESRSELIARVFQHIFTGSR